MADDTVASFAASPRRLSRRSSMRRGPAGEVAGVADDGSRTVLLNGGGANAAAGFVDNSLRSAKYTPLNLLPKALYEQFRRVANFYFLIVAAVSFIPGISPTTPIANVLPLLVVVGFGFARDVYEDILRARSDSATNAQPRVVVRRTGTEEGEGKELVEGGDGEVGRVAAAVRKSGGDSAVREVRVVRSRDIKVGDVVFVAKGNFVPADMVLVSSAAEGGVAYVSTASLDGESNLKRVVCAGALGDRVGADVLREVQAVVKCGAPDMALHRFEGSIIVSAGATEGGGSAVPLDSGNLMLRGSMLRNTDWVYGIAVYTGSESKISLNMRHPPSKMGTTEKKLNWVVLALFLNLLVLIVLASVVGGVLQGRSGMGQWYMGEFRTTATGVTILKGFGTFLVLFSTYIPVSLFVTLEFVRVCQGVFMSVDRKMTSKGAKVAVKATNLNEVLGLVQFVLSDKTGTLTQNIMRYISCSAGGKLYDTSKKRRVMENAVAGDVAEIKDLILAMALCHSVVPEPKEDAEEVVPVGDGDADTSAAVADVEVGDGSGSADELPEYQGQSPDEVALVTSAREYGCALIERTLDEMVVDRFGTRERYEALAELEFNSDRKRMSMIFRCPDGTVRMFCKGADTIMMPLLRGGPEVDVAQEHIDLFAKGGLRTLVYAGKTLPEEEYQAWMKDFTAARNLLTARDEAVAEISARLEVGMDYIAVTAVEDKLQDRVPETIKFLREAGVGLWVLTGDKRETAENIGYSANLLDRQMNVVHIQATDADELLAQLEDARLRFARPDAAAGGGKVVRERDMRLSLDTSGDEDEPENEDAFPLASHARVDRDSNADRPSAGGGALIKRTSSLVGDGLKSVAAALSPRRSTEIQHAELALIIDGASLAHAIETHPEAFMELADYCKTVICCRVTPLQKALVVRMVREMRKAMTLAIGDGGNDVSMIQEAHVGVGLFGKEGTQAARAGDYAMSEFKHLQRLLSVHGRYSYVRTAGTIKLSFYKNIVFTATQVLFQIFNFVSGTTFQDQWIVSSFNVVVTAMSPFLYGIFEKDLEESTITRFPEVYASNRSDRLFSVLAVAEFTFLYGLWHAVCVFFGTFFGMGYLSIPFQDGRDGGLYMTALGTALMIVVIVLSKFIMHTHNLNWLVILALVLSFGIFFAVIPLAIFVVQEYPLEGVLAMLLSSPHFYLTGVMVFGACYILDFAILAIRQLLYPDVVATLQEWERSNRRLTRRNRKAGSLEAGESVLR